MRPESNEALYSLATTRTPDPAQVGGKGSALIEMTRAGLPVPPGFVLTTGFFRPWLEELRATAEWNAFVAAVGADEPSDEELRKRTADLEAACEDLSFSEPQQRQLSEALEELRDPESPSGPVSGSGLVAVRSSAPQEDLVGASFAGVYESFVGITAGNLREAVRAVFVSGLAFKVVSYKRRRGFDPLQVEIAVVVQQQVDSESAGVAFSLNPQNNDYDEAVVHANWGLGETVVSGSVGPDRFIVDKPSERLVEKKPGTKETSLWSRPEGGSVQAHDEHGNNGGRFALTDRQAVQISRMVQRVETITAVPVDVEWAYGSDGTLSLLQARPVTTYFPLPAELRTAPGAPRRLYADSTLLEEGLHEPLSVLGSRWMADAIVEMIRQATGRRISTQDGDGLVLTVGGRWYMNVSRVLWLGRQRLATSLEALDVHAAQVMRNVEVQRYRKAAAQPKVAKIAGLAWGTLTGFAGPVGTMLAGVAAPDRARRRYEAAVERHRRQLAEVARQARSVPELGDGVLMPAVHLLMREGLPLTYAAEAAKALLRLLYLGAPSRQRQLLDAAFRSMPHNITIEMGLALYRLARSLEESVGEEGYADLTALARRIETRELPEQFLREWDAFMDRYGFRGPNELDLASVRYADDPMLALEQMRQYVLLDESTQERPGHAYERRQRERREAYRKLLDGTRNPVTRWLVTRLYRAAETFSGFREIHKYHLVMAGYEVRRRALQVGGELVERGRLDSAEQVFDLDYENLHGGFDVSEPDLRARAHSNTRYRREIARTPGAGFPVLVDSRGNIPRPASTAAGPGVFSGEGVSTGTARGPVKVLSHVGEKPVLPGEVLVARATDPGWTPLFVNAAGIVLETGGSFQHGALVAREYGKPCIVGIDKATQQVSDGQLVELDGEAGTMTCVARTPSPGR
ncbi:pyruvate,water dikinase [Halopolyspora algeriensis]|uniref:Pyruvate,water dikinase n=1 Tax=Halopolyspora algeriensis TaxID=1500506 RepID=A0A368VVZ1_9ACTN|nr:PEP/pyruvate-binding domain-containing protein [Halopolyspora algeriensis]RCW46045.1 pyruvate,water dikinase [Halopolyspora algeriensis]TQM55457.1 pyruvate,water dikinase [Halopolyspora algeriensis]